MKIVHVIHPVVVSKDSDLVLAQPITFKTMEVAKKYVKGSLDVSLFAIQYHDEKRIPLHEDFTRLPDLKHSIRDFISFRETRKLALIKEILDALYEATEGCDFMIYTNVDIALQPYFYQAVAEIINLGYDSFVINRRTITERYSLIPQIPLMYAEIGESHKGYDCFIFRREMYPKFKLGSISIGTAFIGRTLLANLVSYSSKFKEFRDLHLTFHIGDPCPWRKEEFFDYLQHNKDEYLMLFNELEKEYGEFDSIWRSYLLDTGAKRKFPDFL